MTFLHNLVHRHRSTRQSTSPAPSRGAPNSAAGAPATNVTVAMGARTSRPLRRRGFFQRTPSRALSSEEQFADRMAHLADRLQSSNSPLQQRGVVLEFAQIVRGNGGWQANRAREAVTELLRSPGRLDSRTVELLRSLTIDEGASQEAPPAYQAIAPEGSSVPAELLAQEPVIVRPESPDDWLPTYDTAVAAGPSAPPTTQTNSPAARNAGARAPASSASPAPVRTLPYTVSHDGVSITRRGDRFMVRGSGYSTDVSLTASAMGPVATLVGGHGWIHGKQVIKNGFPIGAGETEAPEPTTFPGRSTVSFGHSSARPSTSNPLRGTTSFAPPSDRPLLSVGESAFATGRARPPTAAPALAPTSLSDFLGALGSGTDYDRFERLTTWLTANPQALSGGDAEAILAKIGSTHYQNEALRLIAPKLPALSVGDATAILKKIDSPHYQNEALGLIACKLSSLCACDVWAILRSIDGDHYRVEALGVLKSKLAPLSADGAATILRAIRSDHYCLEALSSLAPLVPGVTRRENIATITSVRPSPYYRERARAVLSRY